MMDEGNFVHWKARMGHIMHGIDADAWTAVELGWTAPSKCMEDIHIHKNLSRDGQNQKKLHQCSTPRHSL